MFFAYMHKKSPSLPLNRKFRCGSQVYNRSFIVLSHISSIGGSAGKISFHGVRDWRSHLPTTCKNWTLNNLNNEPHDDDDGAVLRR